MDSTSLLPRFPQELIDGILKHISDEATLRSCAHVCWAFLPTSQASIFSTVELTPRNSRVASSPCERLHSVLRESPHLNGYIRTLKILESAKPGTWWTPNEGLWRPTDSKLSEAGQDRHTDFCQTSSLVSLMMIVVPREDEDVSIHPRMKTFVIGDMDHTSLGLITRWLGPGHCLSNLQSFTFTWNQTNASHLQTMINAMPTLHELTSYLKHYTTLQRICSSELKTIRVVRITIDTVSVTPDSMYHGSHES
ncbi:hypothetical protein B0H13DRAFT_2365152 [Mycena leptocephala]|nr:hypothetical protein B0H13DRAFT_2365152 [Mycena leptocephala]